MQVEVNALGMKLAEQAEQVLERAAEAVDRPCGDHVLSRLQRKVLLMQVLNLTRLPRASKIRYFPDRLLVQPSGVFTSPRGERFGESNRE